MIRREALLRRDYLHRKSLALQQQTTTERKSSLRQALTSGKRIKTDLKYQGTDLIKDLLFDEHELLQDHPSTNQDDEYSNAGFQDPKVVITTSRDPSSKLSQFSKEVRLLFPGSQRINRGNHVIKDIVASCKKNSVSDLIILHEHRGVPDGMIISHFPHGPTAFFSLHNVALRHDMPQDSAAASTISEAFPHLIMHNFATKLGERTRNILKHLFPVPKEDSKRIVTFSNLDDFISFRHHVYRRGVGGKIELAEMGPRFEMRLYQIKLGTVDIEEADTEWVLHSFMNTAKKHNYL